MVFLKNNASELKQSLSGARKTGNYKSWIVVLKKSAVSSISLESTCGLQSSRTLHKKWGFPFRISSVNMTKSAVISILTQDISDTIISSKLKYYERLAGKLNDLKTVTKTYWKILKTFVNGTRFHWYLRCLLVENQLISDFW